MPFRKFRRSSSKDSPELIDSPSKSDCESCYPTEFYQDHVCIKDRPHGIGLHYDISSNESKSEPQKTNNPSVPETVELISPSDLPEGYQFVVRSNDEEYLVEVPKYGVTQGQTFSARIVPEDGTHLRAQPGHKIPHGFWRDGLFDCFSFGIFHPALCLACFAPFVLLSQIMTRLGLDSRGRPVQSQGKNAAEISGKRLAFGNISCLFLLHFVLVETALSAVVVAKIHARKAGHGPVPVWAYLLLAVRATCRISLFVYFVLLSLRTRIHVRDRYGIHDEQKNACREDVLVSIFCNMLSLAQMARHTANYETYDATCSTSTGLSEYAPPV